MYKWNSFSKANIPGGVNEKCCHGGLPLRWPLRILSMKIERTSQAEAPILEYYKVKNIGRTGL